MDYEYYMELAIDVAKTGIKNCEQPYGAVLVADGKIIYKAFNKVRSTRNSTNHAEIVVLNQYKNSNMKDVKELILVTTCEPCEHCFNMAIEAGVNRFVFGSNIEEAIKYNTGDKLLKIKQFEKKYNISVIENIKKEECDELFKEFYDTDYLSKNIVTYSSGTEEERYWMKRALDIGRKGMIEKNELPIGVILVAGDEVLSETCTLTYTLNSPITHGDFMALAKAERKVYSSKKPLVLYSTLEPCLLGFGAAIKCKVDKIVFGMEAIPDGGADYLPHMVNVKEWIPKTVGGVCREEQYELMKEFLETHNEKRVGWDYANKIVNLYEQGMNKMAI